MESGYYFYFVGEVDIRRLRKLFEVVVLISLVEKLGFKFNFVRLVLFL